MKYRSCLVLAFLISVHLITGSAAVAQKRRPAARSVRPIVHASQAASRPPAVERRVQAFEKVWSAINENYFDRTFNGLDWQKVRREFLPRAAAARNDVELHALLNEMIGRLQRSHLAVISPEVYQAIERAKVEAKAREAAASSSQSKEDDGSPNEESVLDDPLSEYGIGVDLRILDEKFVVSRVDERSSAANAGLRIGYTIEKVNGVSLATLLRSIGTQSADALKLRKYLPFQIVNGFLNGDRDSFVTVTYSDETDTLREARIRRERIPTQTISLGNNFPERQLRFEAYSLSDDVGYIRFNIFAIPVIGKFCDALTRFKTKKAIVIDLRGNLGGVLASLVAIGGMLTEDSIDLGTSLYRTGSETLIANSKKNNFKGRLALLVDNQTVSAAEIFAASLQDAGRAVVIGDVTAGEALPSIAVALPTGGVLLYPIANYRSPAGRFLEGNGVKPDRAVRLDRRSLLSRRDEQLEMALTLFREPQTAPKAATIESLQPAVTVATKTDSPPPSKPVPAALEPSPPKVAAPVKPAPDIKDAMSLQVLSAFTAKVGGLQKIRDIKSYSMKGKAEIVLKGSRNLFDLSIFYQNPGKYAEIMNSAAAGEVREVHNGATHFVQTDYGMIRDLPAFANTGDLDILAPVRTVADPSFYRSLTFAGAFDREGRKVNLIDARTKDGYYLALAFDAETKLLVSFTGSYYALNFSDYRPADGLLLPHTIERERIMNVNIDEIKINTAIDDSNFSKKENCFDREN